MTSHNTPTLTPAGNSFSTATPIAGSDIKKSYLLEFGNFDDFYSFTAPSDGELTASLTSISTEPELSADLDLKVFEGLTERFPVTSSETGGRFDEEVTFEATQGTEYFIWVDHYAGGATNYSLITSFTESGGPTSPDPDPDTPTEPEPPVDDGDPFPNIDAGDSFEEATTLSANATREESVGFGDDADDYFRVTAPGDGDLTVSLTGMSDDIDLMLYDADRNRIDRSTAGGSSDETVTASVESGRSYFVRVDPFGSSESGYTLTTDFEAAEVDTPTDPEPDIDLEADTWMFPEFQVDVSGARNRVQNSDGDYVAVGPTAIAFQNGVEALVEDVIFSSDGSDVRILGNPDSVTRARYGTQEYDITPAGWNADFEANEVDYFFPKDAFARVDQDYLTELFFGNAPGEVLPPDPLPEQGALTVSNGSEERTFTTGFLQVNGLSDEQPTDEFLDQFVNVDSVTISPLAGEGELHISAGSTYDSSLVIGGRDLDIAFKDLAVTTDGGSEFTFDTADKIFSLDFADSNYFPIEKPSLQPSSGNLGTLDSKTIDRIEFERDGIFFVMDGGSERLDFDAFSDLVDTVSSDAPTDDNGADVPPFAGDPPDGDDGFREVDTSVANYQIIGVEWGTETRELQSLRPGDIANFNLYVREGGSPIDEFSIDVLSKRSIINTSRLNDREDDPATGVADGIDLFAFPDRDGSAALPPQFLGEQFSLERYGTFRQIHAGDPVEADNGLLKYELGVRVPYAVAHLEDNFTDGKWEIFPRIKTDYQRTAGEVIDDIFDNLFGPNPTIFELEGLSVDMSTPATMRTEAAPTALGTEALGWIAEPGDFFWYDLDFEPGVEYEIELNPAAGSNFKGNLRPFDANGNPIVNENGQQLGATPDSDGKIAFTRNLILEGKPIEYFVVDGVDQSVGGFNLEIRPIEESSPPTANDNTIPSIDPNVVEPDDTGKATASVVAEEFVLESGAGSTISGSPGDFDGDVVTGFDISHSVTFLDTLFGVSDVTFSSGSVIMDIDTNADGDSDTNLTFAGEDDPESFVFSQEDGSTVIGLEDDPVVNEDPILTGSVTDAAENSLSGLSLAINGETVATDASGAFTVSQGVDASGTLTASGGSPGSTPDASDGAAIMRMAMGLSEPDEFELIAADVNQDGAVTAADAQAVYKDASGLASDGQVGEYILLDADADYSGANLADTGYSGGVDIPALTDDLDVSLIALQLGQTDQFDFA